MDEAVDYAADHAVEHGTAVVVSRDGRFLVALMMAAIPSGQNKTAIRRGRGMRVRLCMSVMS